MEFKEHCDQASAQLRELSDLIDNLEEGIDLLEENRTSTQLSTTLVQGMREANRLSEAIRFEHIFYIREEEPGIAAAIDIALNELVKRMWTVNNDLELISKLQHNKTARPKISPVKTRLTLLPI